MDGITLLWMCKQYTVWYYSTVDVIQYTVCYYSTVEVE